ncbi:MAG TPA: ABC transporter substrate-binding protein [Usitatibacteraceae bacterium]|nr:ABC transporter substrate-binding protein [Usitatibacteraceae bacterium]
MRIQRLSTILFACLLAPLLAVPLAAKTLRYASQDDPQTLDPHSSNLLPTNRVLASVYEGLVGRDKNYKIVPWLALSWSQPDAGTWRFKLRPNVKFHGGEEFTADDVVFSVERALHPLSQMKSSLQGVKGAKKVDKLTVDLILAEPNPVLLNHLFQFRIASKEWAEKNKAQAPQNYKDREDTFSSRNANGTGPFKVTVRQPDVKTVLVANENWWNKGSPEKGNLTQIDILPVKSNATRAAALLSGEVDFVLDPPPQDIARLKTNANVKIVEGAEARVQYLAFDTFRDELLYSDVKGKNPLKDVRVRQAIAHAIDVDAIKDKVMRGLSIPTGTLVPRGVQGYSKEAEKRHDYDREKARKLLAEAGYPSGFGITIDCGNIQPAADICQALPPMLGQVGIRATPNIIPQANYFPKIQKFDTSMYILSWGSATFDALYNLQLLLHTSTGDNTGYGDSNYGRYSNKKMDELIGKIKVEADMKKRDGLIREALLLHNREVATLPLHQPLVPWAMRKNVEAVFTPNNVPYFFRFRMN